MKLTKEEFIEKYSSHFENDDEKIAFLEDISDSIEVKDDSGEEVEKLNATIEQLKTDNEMLKQKYIDRFLSGEEAEEKAEEFEDKIEEPEEKEIIDIKEI